MAKKIIKIPGIPVGKLESSAESRLTGMAKLLGEALIGFYEILLSIDAKGQNPLNSERVSNSRRRIEDLLLIAKGDCERYRATYEQLLREFNLDRDAKAEITRKAKDYKNGIVRGYA